jgi:hypothetical protein
MIAIPQEEYLQLSTVQNVRQPLTQQFYNLESQHNEEAKIKDPYKRLVLQSETLNEMKELKEKMRHYLTVSTPKPYRTRAQALLESVSSFLQFNERGEIYDTDNNIIPNTRLEDLIQHSVRDRRRNISPTGWSYFLRRLMENNIPRSILNRGTIDEMEAMMSTSKASSEVDVKQEVKTPLKRRKWKTPTRVSKRAKIPSQKLLDHFAFY